MATPIPPEINSAIISAIASIITATGAAIIRFIEKARLEKRLRAELTKPQEPCTTTEQPK